ncbi:hypothetical protein E3V39_14845 [Gammaproteobacteria bacterium LSUCC0112]|nr:hypothetical protein E3V39_14845 [Gammaproteobacteria bacterium LSUCC0112]
MFTLSKLSAAFSTGRVFSFVVIMMLAALWLKPTLAQSEIQLTGTWRGTLIAAQFDPLEIVLHITAAGGKDAYSATLDIPAQFRNGLPVASISLKNNNVLLSIPTLDAEFFGSLMFDAEGVQVVALNGDWSQSGEHIPLRLERSN